MRRLQGQVTKKPFADGYRNFIARSITIAQNTIAGSKMTSASVRSGARIKAFFDDVILRSADLIYSPVRQIGYPLIK
jgi:hypothetical protein